MTHMPDAAGDRVEHVDASIAGTDPDLTSRVDLEGAHAVAGQRVGVGRIVAVDDERVGLALPAGHAAITNRDPKIAGGVFGDVPDEVSGK